MQSILNERTGVVKIEKSGSKNVDNSICGICLSDSTNLTSIFSPHMGGKPTIGDMLTRFCSFQLTEDGDFFDQICEKCSRETVRAYNFKLKCEKSYELLLRQAKEINIKMDPEFFPLETIDTDYVDLNSATVEVKTEDISLLQEELDIPYLKTETIDDPTGFGEVESFETPIVAGHQNKDVEITLLPTEKLINFITSVHKYALTRPILYDCSKCSYTSELESRLKTHMKFLHSGKKSSSRKFQTRLKKLIVQHSKEKRFKCDTCNFSTSYKHSLEELKNKPLGNKCLGNERFSCYRCGKLFMTKISLEIHTRTHIGGKPHSCCFFNFSTNNREYLKVHKRIHTGKILLACNKCSRLFKNEKHLKMHKLTHSGIRAFSCEKCDRSFALKSNLIAHMFTHSNLNAHTGKKPFACDQCDYSSSHKIDLRYHLLSHSARKPFSCEECNFTCIRNNAFRTHMLSHGYEC